MKKLVIATALGLCFALPALADPVDGAWKTQPGAEGKFVIVQIAACGDKVCGTMAKLLGPDGKQIISPNVGKKMIWDMVAKGNGVYEDGRIWAPDKDKTYNSHMQLSGDTLAVSGCVWGGLICRSQRWTRVK
ncbi:MAG: DUF2147 domain-containing protein [Paracoccaceae bacterium]|nr:DUF2147 domain-containing protein [Paracoccaceae bacterium]